MGGAQDLLRQQQEKQNKPADPIESLVEPSSVKRAKDEADIATANDKKAESEIKTKLRQQKYDTLEAKETALNQKEAELKKREDALVKQEQEIATQFETIEQDKAKVTNAYAIVKKREEATNARLEQAIKLENEQKAKVDEAETLKVELGQLIEYQRTHLKPCRKALLNVSKAIYSWVEPLQESKIDFIELYNYIGAVMKVVDRYIERTDGHQESPK